MADEANAIFLTVDQNSVLYGKHRIMKVDGTASALNFFVCCTGLNLSGECVQQDLHALR